MRKAEVFFDAITAIRAELIDEALDYRFTKRAVPWRRYMGLAACLALVAVVGFGAIRLGLLGGMGGSDSASSSNCAAPETAENTGAASDDAAMDPGDGNYGGDSGDSSGTQAEESVFGATVLEVHDGYLLVEPLAGEAILASADRIMVSVANVEEMPELEAGDKVAIIFDGMIKESYPAQVTALDIDYLREELGTP